MRRKNTLRGWWIIPAAAVGLLLWAVILRWVGVL